MLEVTHRQRVLAKIDRLRAVEPIFTTPSLALFGGFASVPFIVVSCKARTQSQSSLSENCAWVSASLARKSMGTYDWYFALEVVREIWKR